MKSRFSTLDIRVILAELQKSSAMGLRVGNVYDIDNKTYLIKLGGTDVKLTLLIESGNRLHLTEFDWPKNSFPSGFSMKCRKHINGRRLSSANQLGVDRIVDLCFGYDEAAYHLVIELYDRGNIVLTDYQYTILQILRTRTDNEDVRFAVKERYPVEKARENEPPISRDRLKEILLAAKPKDVVKRVLNPHFVFGPALLEHCILESGLDGNVKAGQCLNNEEDIDALIHALQMADRLMFGNDMPLDKGFIIQRTQETSSLGTEQTENNELHTYAEFHPCFFKQFEGRPFLEFDSFNKAVDEFFSKLESQKLDVKALAKEKMALKKLENVRKDHEKRVEALQKSQDEDMRKAGLIEMNLPLVDQAIKVLNSAIANQIDWEEIEDIVKEAQAQHDPVALAIKSLKLSSNQFTILLSDPFGDGTEDSSSDSGLDESVGKNTSSKKGAGVLVDIDLGMNAFGNARGYHTKRRHASKKEEKTMQASKKALKSAERKTRETLKEVATTAVINKARKQYWFEKFLWFISSENYLVVGGRDQQQNEVIVKRYLRQGDLYFHADIHGATSLVLKNPSGQPVPPRTLLEAGTMAICHSAAWEARVVTSAWWVHHNQVSKTAPSGEYLTTGSFMIRGKKNYLPPTQLVMGYGFIFKLDETCIARHLNERRVKEQEAEESNSQIEEETTELDLDEEADDDIPTEAAESLSLEDKGPLHLEEEASIEEDQNDLKDDQEDESPVEASDEEQGEEGPVFPDTSIQLQHVAGDTFHLQSSIAAFPEHQENEDGNDRGERDLDEAQRNKTAEGKQRLSAKQRRELKKQRKGKQGEESRKLSQENEDTADVQENDHGEGNGQPTSDKVKPLKRGQKSKQKKIKEKYKDQDDEDREVVMQLLGSAGKPKEVKSKKEKGKKGGRQVVKQKGKGGAPKSQHIFAEDLPSKSNQTQLQGLEQDEDIEVKEEEEENSELGREDASILDSLTGCPDEEDLLLFAVPVCAPYSSLHSYKFKVKVTPGAGRRGKAAKTALHLFMTSKETTQREKDLFRSLKDTDISRDMPGKVKVSAPNLQKAKHK